MDYAFFEALPREEREAYLHAFLSAGRARVGDEWWSRLTRDGTASIGHYFAHVASVIRVVETPPPADVPPFIVEAMERDHRGFRDFADDASRIEVLGAAFYLGAAFIESHAALHWAVGPDSVADEGQPVVAGFRTGSHLPVLSVAENTLLAFEEQNAATAVSLWSAAV